MVNTKQISMNLKIIVIALVALCLAGCGKGATEFETVRVKGMYSLDLPDFLTKTDNLNDEASLQYQNPFREFYAIVIDEPKTELIKALEVNSLYDYYSADLEGYSQLLLDGIENAAEMNDIPEFTDTKINGLKARTIGLEGVTDGISIYWKIAYIEGNNNYYQVLAWTLSEKRETHEKDMEAIINSFKETDKSKK